MTDSIPFLARPATRPKLRAARRFPVLGAVAALGALFLALACGGEGESAVPARSAFRVTHVRLDGDIDFSALSILTRGIRKAHEHGSEMLLFELHTRGGELEVMNDIQRTLRDAKVDGLDLACWIHDSALSAGALVAMSAPHVYMSSIGTIGSSHPVLAGPDGELRLPEDPVVLEKLNSALRSQFAAQASANGRSPELARAMVEPSVQVQQVRIDNELKLYADEDWDALKESDKVYEVVTTIDSTAHILNMPAQQAVSLRFVDGIADTLEQVLQRLGYTMGDVSPPVGRARSDDLVVWIERLTPLLILAAIVLGYLELKLPGFGLPGILSAACFLAVVAGKYMAGLADVPHIVAVAIGLALLVVEILVVPGALWFGIAGGLLLAGGLISASIGPGFTFSDPAMWERLLDTSLEYAVAAVLAIVVAMVLSRWLPKTPILRRAVLAPDPTGAFAGAMPETVELPALGARGVALTDLRPVGKVAIDGNLGVEFEARSVGAFVLAGSRVRVLEVGSGRLVVEGLPEDAS